MAFVATSDRLVRQEGAASGAPTNAPTALGPANTISSRLPAGFVGVARGFEPRAAGPANARIRPPTSIDGSIQPGDQRAPTRIRPHPPRVLVLRRQPRRRSPPDHLPRLRQGPPGPLRPGARRPDADQAFPGRSTEHHLA